MRRVYLYAAFLVALFGVSVFTGHVWAWRAIEMRPLTFPFISGERSTVPVDEALLHYSGWRLHEAAREETYSPFHEPDGVDGFPQQIGVRASLLARARLAVAAPLAQRPPAAVYFSAVTDNEGQPLRTECVYRVEGGALWGRWWSFTVYDTDLRLLANPQALYSFNRGDYERMGMERWSLILSRSVGHGAWLPLGEEERPSELSVWLGDTSEPMAGQRADSNFMVRLRVYHLPEGFGKALSAGDLRLPVIHREACMEDEAL